MKNAMRAVVLVLLASLAPSSVAEGKIEDYVVALEAERWVVEPCRRVHEMVGKKRSASDHADIIEMVAGDLNMTGMDASLDPIRRLYHYNFLLGACVRRMLDRSGEFVKFGDTRLPDFR